MSSPANRPLEGLRVVELGALVAAPFCGMLLGDLGAEVIKIEPPEGDMARAFAPFVEGESAFFMSVNRGKRSVAIDVKDPEALSWVRKIAASADVVIHNYRSGVAERLGLGYADLQGDNPGLIYCAVSGFGPSGPMAKRPGIDLIFQAESGMLAITGTADGPPVKVGTNAADVYAATTAAACINAALVRRGITGLGCQVDVSLRDAFLSLQACWFGSYLATGIQPARVGAGSPFTAPTDVYPTADGYIVLAVVNDKHWQIFCETLGLTGIAEDSRFVDNESRVTHVEVLRKIVSDALAARTTADWLSSFKSAQIPAGEVMEYADVVADEQIQLNQMVIEFQHSGGFPVRTQGIPFWFDGVKADLVVPPPALGQHTIEILREMGCTEEAARRLAER